MRLKLADRYGPYKVLEQSQHMVTGHACLLQGCQGPQTWLPRHACQAAAEVLVPAQQRMLSLQSHMLGKDTIRDRFICGAGGGPVADGS